MSQRVVVIGQGYVGLPVAIRAVEVGFDVVGFELDPAKVEALNAGRSHVEDITDDRLADAGHRPLPGDCRHRRPGRLRHRRDLGADADGRGAARPVLHRVRSPHPGRAPVAGRDGHPRVDHLPRHDRGARPPDSGGRLRDSRAGVDFHLGYSPERIDPGQRDLPAGEHPEGRLGCGYSVTRSGAGVLRRHHRVDGAGVGHPRGRAHQAAREHVPPRQHRARQRAGHVRQGPRHRRVGGDRRRLDQALRLHALHARPRRRRTLPADRPVVPVVAGRTLTRPDVPLRRAGQRRQRAHARLRRAPGAVAAQRAAQGGQRLARAGLRPGLQGQHGRRPRDPVASDRRASCSGSAPRCSWSTPTCRHTSSPTGSSGPTAPPPTWPPRTSCSTSSTTRSSTATRSPRPGCRCWTAGGRCRARRSSTECCTAAVAAAHAVGAGARGRSSPPPRWSTRCADLSQASRS